VDEGYATALVGLKCFKGKKEKENLIIIIIFFLETFQSHLGYSLAVVDDD
jgi:hypothetical protein